MKEKQIALIREADCIGCTKCIEVCPVDAILGSAKHMHTVIAAECIGCELCLPPCPVDCIELIPMDQPREVAHTRRRVMARKQRLRQQEITAFHSAAPDPQKYLAEMLKRTRRSGG